VHFSSDILLSGEAGYLFTQTKGCEVNKKIFMCGLMFGLLLVSAAASAELKLAYVNAAKLLEESPQAQKAANKLKDEFGDRESKLIKSKQELDEMQKRLARDGSIMSESNRKQIRLDILSRQRDIVRDDEALRQDISIRRNDILGGLQDLIRGAIDNVGKKGKYDIIFFDGIAYVDTALDITAQILDELKKIDAKTKK